MKTVSSHQSSVMHSTPSAVSDQSAVSSRREAREWRCAQAHVLGMIIRNGSGKPLLELYRHAVDLKADEPAEVDVIGVLSGGMRNIRCDVCWDVRVWHFRERE